MSSVMANRSTSGILLAKVETWLWRDMVSKFKLEDDSRMERSSVLVNYLDSTEAD